MRLPRTILLAIIIAATFAGGPATPKAKAMDPITIAILAPILAPYAAKAADFALQCLMNSTPGWIEIGKELINIFRLPLGVGQLTLGLPFGFAGDGIYNMYMGAKAPFAMVAEVLALPLRGVKMI